MKLFAGIAIGFSLLIQAGDAVRPEAIFRTGSTYIYSGEFDFTKLKKQKYATSFKVTEVTKEGSHWFCNATMTYSYDGVDNKKSCLFQFACDSLNFYALAQNFLFRDIEKLRKGEDNTSGDSLIYPLNMHVGDTLPSAWCKTQITNAEGTTVGMMEFTKRSVEGLDTLKLAFGNVPAYRIVCLKVVSSKVNSGYSGKREVDDVVTIKEWFSPQLGIVRAQEKSVHSFSDISLVQYTAE